MNDKFYLESNHPHHTCIMNSVKQSWRSVTSHLGLHVSLVYSSSMATQKQIIIHELLYTRIFTNKVLQEAKWKKKLKCTTYIHLWK